MSGKKIIKGTLILTAAGFTCRILGFVYKIYLSRILTAEEIGLYHLSSPIIMLAQAVAIGGMGTAVTKHVSAYAGQNKKDKGFINFLASLFFCICLSTLFCIVIINNADFLAEKFIRNTFCTNLLKLSAYSMPFACVHTLIVSFFMGLEFPGVPAFSQVLEQVFRIGSIYIFSCIYTQNGTPFDATIAIYGSITGEIAASLFTVASVILLNEKYKTEKTGLIRNQTYYISEGVLQLGASLKLAWPITANRICIHLIQSLEAVLLPMMLITNGSSQSDSVALYGILTGMSMPLILFPATITNSMSQALLPDVSRAWQSQNLHHLRKSIALSLGMALNLGLICIPCFYFYGSEFGRIIFDNPTVASQTKLLSLLCPLIFISSMLSSTLNGLGKTDTVFISSLIAQIIRLALIVFIVPKTGISGYITGIILSHAFQCTHQYIQIKNITGFRLPFVNLILIPAIKIIICFFATFPAFSFLMNNSVFPEIICYICGGTLYVTACVISILLFRKKD